MVMFVCYVLRLIADEEARAEASSSSSSSEEEGSDEGRFEGSDEDSDTANSSRYHRTRRRPADLMRDARELFRWQGRQKELAKALWDAVGRVVEGRVGSRLLDDPGDYGLVVGRDRAIGGVFIKQPTANSTFYDTAHS